MTTEKTTLITNIKTLLINLPDDIKYLIVRDVFCVNDFLFEMEFFDLSKLTTALKHFFPKSFYYKKNNPLKTDKEKTQACWQKKFGRLTQIEQTIFYFVITDIEGTLQPTDIHLENLKLILIKFTEHRYLLRFFQEYRNQSMLLYCYNHFKTSIKTDPDKYFALFHYVIWCHQSFEILQADLEPSEFNEIIHVNPRIFLSKVIETEHQALLTYFFDNNEIDINDIPNLIKVAIRHYPNKLFTLLIERLNELSFENQFAFLDTAFRSKQFYLASTIIDWHTDHIDGHEDNYFYYSFKESMSRCYNPYHQQKTLIFYSKAKVLSYYTNVEAITCFHNIEQAFQHWINNLYNTDLDQETLALSKATLLQNIEDAYRILSLSIKTKKVYRLLYCLNAAIIFLSFLSFFQLPGIFSFIYLYDLISSGVFTASMIVNIVLHIVAFFLCIAIIGGFVALITWLSFKFNYPLVKKIMMGLDEIDYIISSPIIIILIPFLLGALLGIIIGLSCRFFFTFVTISPILLVIITSLSLCTLIFTIGHCFFYYCFNGFEPNLYYHRFFDTVKDSISETSRFFDSYNDYALLIKQSNIDETFKKNLLTQIQLIKQQICLLSKIEDYELDEQFKLLQTSILNFNNQLQQIEQSSYHTGLLLLGVIMILTIAASILCLTIIYSPEFLTTLNLWWQSNINMLAIVSGCSAGVSVVGFASFYYYGRNPFIQKGHALIKEVDSYLEKTCELPEFFK